MLAAERQARIVEEIHRRGAVRVIEFAQMLGVSDMTIRRDLDALAQQGLLDKVHGGATRRVGARTEEPGFEAKSSRQQPEKEAIAKAAAELVSPRHRGRPVRRHHDMGARARAARGRRPHDRHELDAHRRRAARPAVAPTRTSCVVGGVRTPSDALVGPIAVSALGQLHLDIVFLGVHGMAETAGFTTPNLLEADTDRALVDGRPAARGARRPHEVGHRRAVHDRPSRRRRRRDLRRGAARGRHAPPSPSRSTRCGSCPGRRGVAGETHRRRGSRTAGRSSTSTTTARRRA